MVQELAYPLVQHLVLLRGVPESPFLFLLRSSLGTRVSSPGYPYKPLYPQVPELSYKRAITNIKSCAHTSGEVIPGKSNHSHPLISSINKGKFFTSPDHQMVTHHHLYLPHLFKPTFQRSTISTMAQTRVSLPNSPLIFFFAPQLNPHGVMLCKLCAACHVCVPCHARVCSHTACKFFHFVFPIQILPLDYRCLLWHEWDSNFNVTIVHKHPLFPSGMPRWWWWANY